MGLTQVNTSYYLGQSYHMGRNIITREAQRGKCNVRDLPFRVRCKNRILRFLGGIADLPGPILIKFGTSDRYLMQFWKVFILFQNSEI